MIWFEKEIDIRYADTDQMGVVHHGVYPLYCEMCRILICEGIGFPYHKMEEAGYFLPVVDMTFRFQAPARFGDKIYVRGAIKRLHRRMLEFVYEVRKSEGDLLLCPGSTTHMVTNPDNKAVSFPAHIMEKLATGYEG